MITNSGIGLTAGITLCLVGLVGLAVTIRQYRRRGPVFSAAYFSAAKEDQAKLRTPKAYRYAGNVSLYLTLVSLLLGASLVLDNLYLAHAGATLALAGLLSATIFVVTRDK